jgi:hypothetical protein
MRTILMTAVAAGLAGVGLVAWWTVPAVCLGWLVFGLLDATSGDDD